MKQLKDVALQLGPAEQARLNAAAKAWLERRDPAAQELTAPPAADEPTEQMKAATTRFQQRTAEHNEELIRRQWEEEGMEPMTDGKGGLISVSLAKSLGRFDKTISEAAE